MNVVLVRQYLKPCLFQCENLRCENLKIDERDKLRSLKVSHFKLYGGFFLLLEKK